MDLRVTQNLLCTKDDFEHLTLLPFPLLSVTGRDDRHVPTSVYEVHAGD